MGSKTYLDIIQFCGSLSFSQLREFKERCKCDKNKEFLIATEVLRIKTRQLIERKG